MKKGKKPEAGNDKERILTELIKRHAIGPDSRKDRTLLNYLAGQKYDEVYAGKDTEKRDDDLKRKDN